MRILSALVLFCCLPLFGANAWGQTTQNWKVFSFAYDFQYSPGAPVHLEGDKSFVTDGDPSTSFDIVLERAIGSLYGPRIQMTLFPVDRQAKEVEEVAFVLHVGRGSIRNTTVRLSIGGSSLVLLNKGTIYDGQVLTWKKPSYITRPVFLDTFVVQIDAVNYFNVGALGNPMGFSEIVVKGPAQTPLELSVSPTLMSLNEEGWPQPNPVTIDVTASCPDTTPLRCQGDLELQIGAAGGMPRFFVYDDAFATSYSCVVTVDDPQRLFSSRSYSIQCPFELFPGQSVTYPVRLWVQPSEAGSLGIQASWQGTQQQASVAIPAAAIRPVVFLHGIQGSQPPTDQLIVSDQEMRRRLDPFNGYYWPMLTHLQKMGYEWNKTLFAIAYDWRNSNSVSAAFLDQELQRTIKPNAAGVPYVEQQNSQAKVDLIVHSMGGMVSRAYLQGVGKTRRDIDKIVFVASPHKGFPFDYTTWENMDWADYMDGAGSLPGVPWVFARGMNLRIWPAYVGKHYQPTNDDLVQECTFFNRGVDVVDAVGGYVKLGMMDRFLGVFFCDSNTIARWAHHQTRGIPSLQEMLPTSEYPRYLYAEDGVSPGPHTRETNSFLEALNQTAEADLEAALLDGPGDSLANHVYAVYGDGAPETDVGYKVKPRPTSTPDMWRRGEVVGRVDVQVNGQPLTGDTLVPSVSACLTCGPHPLLPNLPPENDVALDASPAAPVQRARHSSMMYHPDFLQKWLPRFLTGLGRTDGRTIPFVSEAQTPLFPLQTSVVLLVSSCPVNLLVTDARGRKLGSDGTSVFREIPGGVYSGANVEPQFLLLPSPSDGQYALAITGYDDGDYVVQASYTPESGAPTTRLELFAGLTSPGQTDTGGFVVDSSRLSPGPVAADDTFQATVETPVVLEVTANDSVPPSAITLTISTPPAHGTVVVRGLDVEYTGAEAGPDAFEYTLSDGVQSSTARVSVQVEAPAVNEPPVASADSYVGSGIVSVPAPGVLGNDVDPEGGVLQAVLVAPPAQGTVVLAADGGFTYTPAGGFFGIDSFTYKASDAQSDSNVVAVTLQIERVNRAPAAANDSYRYGDGPLEIVAPGVLGNDGDPDGDPLSAVLVSGPAHGRLELSPDGSFVYEADADFMGMDEFRYRTSDGSMDSLEAVVSLRPVSACEELYGVDLSADALIQIDPATGEGAFVGELGMAVDTVGLDFDGKGRLWGLSRSEEDASQMLLYTVDLTSGAAHVVQQFDLSEDPRPLGGGVGVEFGPDGKTLYWISGAYLSVLDIEQGKIIPFPSEEGLSFSSVSLSLPGRCQEFVSFDNTQLRLMRVSPWDGTVQEIGPTGLESAINSLAAAPDGTLYGHTGGRLYRFDLSTGAATEIGPIGFSTPGLAFRPAYSGKICLDARYDKKTGLSRYVREVNKRVKHVNKCKKKDDDRSEDDRSEDDESEDRRRGDDDDKGKSHAKHGKGKQGGELRGHSDDDDSSDDRSDDSDDDRSGGKHRSDCGTCGSKGYYELRDRAELVFETPELPKSGAYWLRFQVRAKAGKKTARLHAQVGERALQLVVSGDRWRWTEPVRVFLEEGQNGIRLRAKGRIDIEGVRMEQDCPGLCDGDKANACLDRGLTEQGLSRYVVSVEGQAAHLSRKDGCCGAKGFYYVAGGGTSDPGRIVAEVEVSESGRYLFSVKYRVGSKHQEEESVRVVVGGRSFDLLDRELKNTNRWEWSRKFEVSLEAGRRPMEFVSIGKDKVHLERIRLERVCECGR